MNYILSSYIKYAFFSQPFNLITGSPIFGTYEKYVDAGLYVSKPIEYFNQFMEEWFQVDWLRGIVQNQQDLQEEYQDYLFIGDLTMDVSHVILFNEPTVLPY